MAVKVLVMGFGTEVLADVIDETETSYVVKNPVNLVYDQEGARIVAINWPRLTDEQGTEVKQRNRKVVIDKRHVAVYTEPSKNVGQSYQEAFTNLVLPQSTVVDSPLG